MIITMATVQSKPEIKVELTTADVGTLWRYGCVIYKAGLPSKDMQFCAVVYVQKDTNIPMDVLFGKIEGDNQMVIFISLDAMVEVLNAGSQRHAIAQSDLTVMLCIKGA